MGNQNSSIPTEINDDILAAILKNLPVKTLIQFQLVSKLCLTLIKQPSLAKLHYAHFATNDPPLNTFITAYNSLTRHRHILAVSRPAETPSRAAETPSRAPSPPPRSVRSIMNGPFGIPPARVINSRAVMPGPRAAPFASLPRLTPLVTFSAPTITSKETTECEHLNGLVLFNSGNGFVENDYAFLINPTTRETVKISVPVSAYSYGKVHICYFFGYDELRNEHKVLNIRMLDIKVLNISSVEVMLYELSSSAWRKIDVDLPFDISGDRWCYGTKHSVCVNSVIYVMLQSRNEILAFDLRTEMFEIIDLPSGAIHDIPQVLSKQVCKKGFNTIVSNQPFLMKVHGLLGVVCYDGEAASYEMCIWLLKDYEKRVWVRESFLFCNSLFIVDGPFLLNPYFRKHVVVPMYDMERETVEPVTLIYALHDLFPHSANVRLDHVRNDVESIFPIRRNGSRTSQAG